MKLSLIARAVELISYLLGVLLPWALERSLFDASLALPDPNVRIRDRCATMVAAAGGIRMDQRALWEQGRIAWPGVDLTAEQLAQHLAESGAAERDAQARAADLYLACGCALGVAAALQALETSVLSQVARFVARFDPSPAFADEVRQIVRERLLVAAPGERPRIAAYAGRGPLAGWVRVSAVRCAIDLMRGRRHDLPLEPSHAPAMPDDDPETALIKARYGSAYSAALKTALAGLTARERNLLRMSFVDGSTVEQIAKAYGSHRTTVWRWIEQAREKLLTETLRILGEQLRLGPDEFRSLTQVVRSQLHVSLTGLYSG